jgi:hypothetical protein
VKRRGRGVGFGQFHNFLAINPEVLELQLAKCSTILYHRHGHRHYDVNFNVQFILCFVDVAVEWLL